MWWFLVFYYIFSVLYMIGHCDFTYTNVWWMFIIVAIMILIIAPFYFPISLGKGT